MKRHLAVLHPHRDPPGDIDYRGRVEAANCMWCRWKDPFSSLNYDTTANCSHPNQRFQTRRTYQPSDWRGVCSDWNHDGACPGYEPTRLTRLLRFFGLRRPAWRDA